MSAVSNQMRDAGAILPAVDAVSQPRALLIEFCALAAGIVLFALLASASMSSGSFGGFGFGWLLFVILAGTGFNAAGIALMDDELRAPRRSFADLLVAGAFAFAKCMAVAILAGIAAIIVMLAVALLLWICKIPGVGPVLFFVAFPVSALVLGVLWAAFAFVLAPIAAPAIWSGQSIGTTLATVLAVVRKRLLGVVVRGCVLWLLLAVTAGVLWAIAFSGAAATSALSFGIVGVDIDGSMLGGLFGDANPYGRRGMRPGRMPSAPSGGGYGVAMIVGIGLIVAAVGTLLSLVLKKGWCLIYLQTARDLDVSAVEAEMQAKLAQVRAQAQAARERVQQQNRAAREAGNPPGTTDPSGPPQ